MLGNIELSVKKPDQATQKIMKKKKGGREKSEAKRGGFNFDNSRNALVTFMKVTPEQKKKQSVFSGGAQGRED